MYDSLLSVLAGRCEHYRLQGAIDEFENLFKTHSPSQQVLSKNAAFLRQKIRIMNLMDMVFTRASNDRNIPFAEIAKVCKVTADEVKSWGLPRSARYVVVLSVGLG